MKIRTLTILVVLFPLVAISQSQLFTQSETYTYKVDFRGKHLTDLPCDEISSYYYDELDQRVVHGPLTINGDIPHGNDEDKLSFFTKANFVDGVLEGDFKQKFEIAGKYDGSRLQHEWHLDGHYENGLPDGVWEFSQDVMYNLNEDVYIPSFEYGFKIKYVEGQPEEVSFEEYLNPRRYEDSEIKLTYRFGKLVSGKLTRYNTEYVINQGFITSVYKNKDGNVMPMEPEHWRIMDSLLAGHISEDALSEQGYYLEDYPGLPDVTEKLKNFFGEYYVNISHFDHDFQCPSVSGKVKILVQLKEADPEEIANKVFNENFKDKEDAFFLQEDEAWHEVLAAFDEITLQQRVAGEAKTITADVRQKAMTKLKRKFEQRVSEAKRVQLEKEKRLAEVEKNKREGVDKYTRFANSFMEEVLNMKPNEQKRTLGEMSPMVGYRDVILDDCSIDDNGKYQGGWALVTIEKFCSKNYGNEYYRTSFYIYPVNGGTLKVSTNTMFEKKERVRGEWDVIRGLKDSIKTNNDTIERYEDSFGEITQTFKSYQKKYNQKISKDLNETISRLQYLVDRQKECVDFILLSDTLRNLENTIAKQVHGKIASIYNTYLKEKQITYIPGTTTVVQLRPIVATLRQFSRMLNEQDLKALNKKVKKQKINTLEGVMNLKI